MISTMAQDDELVDDPRFNTSGPVLAIRSAEAADSGAYLCRAVNGFGARDIPFQLVVAGTEFRGPFTEFRGSWPLSP